MPTATYTTPVDVVDYPAAASFLTAAWMNTYWTNNLFFLYKKGHQQVSGAFPGSPATNDKAFRTDRGLDYYYNGSQWLTINEYSVPITPLVAGNTVSFYVSPHIVLPTTYNLYVTSIVANIRVNTTNNGSNYWTLFIQGHNDSLTASQDTTTFSTAALAVNTYVTVTNTINAAPTNDSVWRVVTVKTGTPGSLDFAVHMNYRLIG